MVIGLTGGIATGKSLVSQELERLGAHIIDADIIAREIVEPGKPAYNEIAAEFGEDILLPDKTLNRKKLGKIVFSNKEALSKLNAITHPRIRQRIREEMQKASAADGGAIIVVNIALLIEMGFKDEVEKVILVHAGTEKQIERLLSRDGFTREEALQRISCQMPGDEKLKYADYVIKNNGTPEAVAERTREVFRELLAEKYKKTLDSPQ